MLDFLKILGIIIGVMTILKFISSFFMCVGGYKWRKNLIGFTGYLIGFNAGLLTAIYLLVNTSLAEKSLIIIPIETILVGRLAYKNIIFNHFLAGFLVAEKLSILFLQILMDKNIIEFNLKLLIILPVVLGFITGFIGCKFYNYGVVLMCISFIGATSVVPSLMKIINGGLFLSTGDINFVVETDISKIMLKIIGIEIPSLIEGIVVILIFILAFQWNKYCAIRDGKDLSMSIIDDTKYKK